MLFFLIPLLLLILSNADEHDHKYKDNEEVVLWMNTVGPFHNRQETYPYFSLPFCPGQKKDIGHYHETLGEALLGVELEFSGLEINFKKDVATTVICEMIYKKEDIDALKYAINNQYWYQMYLDNLPIWKTVGGLDKDEYFIWTQKAFEIEYNKDQIVGITVSSGKKVILTEGQTVSFSYKVKWIESSVDFENRYDRYLDIDFFEHKIHWFSIFNSFFMVLFLVALVTIILMRTLRKDYARYNTEPDSTDLEGDFGNEYGWKQIHGDVFRPIPNPTLFTSFIGNGVQICGVAIIVSGMAFLGKMYTERGSLMSTAIFVYTITSPINGFAGGSLYSRLKGSRWIRQFIASSLLFPISIGIICFFVNNTALYYQSSRAIPFLTIISLLAIIVLVVIPLNLLGTLLGRNLLGQANNPCRVNNVPKPIPRKKWFHEPWALAALGGLLPFGSIFIEMYFIFTSFWAYKIYFVFGFTLLVLIMLLLVTACVSIVGIYFILNSEDYRWQWTSFKIGSSVGLYVYLYSIYYFLFKTKMYGLFQTTFFFGTMALFCLSISLMCGAIAFLATSRFVKKIYSTVKVD